MQKELHFAGVIDSEETFTAKLGDGRTLYVQLCAMAHAQYGQGLTEEQTYNTQYWLDLLDGRDANRVDDYPSVWIKKAVL